MAHAAPVKFARPLEGATVERPLPPRRAHCQRTEARGRGEPGGEVGTIAWEEHVEACRVRGVDPERVAAAGGLDYAAVALLLGRVPATWQAWK